MAIQKTGAIVLKTWKFGETSKIVSLLTRDYGKIRVMAKGARSQKSAFKGCLEPLSHIHIVYYDKKTRNLQLLSKTDLVDPHVRFMGDMLRTTLGFAAAELVNKALMDNEPQADIFDLLKNVLSSMNKYDGFLEGLFWYFEETFISMMGYKPTWDACLRCKSSLGLGGGYFQPDSGGLLCPQCGSHSGGLRISPESLDILFWMQKAPLADITRLSPVPGVTKEIRKMFDLYFKTHVDLKNGLHSLDVFYELTQGGAI